MVKLSDYLDYLYQEVIQARIKVDEQAVELAKIYSKHEYLKYFRVPRFTIPNVKLEIPLKINEIDAETKYNFKMNETTYINEVNEKIEKVNKVKKVKIKRISKKNLKEFNFSEISKTLEKRDYRFVKRIDESINKIDFIKKMNVKSENFMDAAVDLTLQKEELNLILKDSLKNQFTPVSAKINNIFIDPDTTKELDKDKILLKLNVEMVEEGLRIVRLKDENGNEFEEIVFE